MREEEAKSQKLVCRAESEVDGTNLDFGTLDVEEG